MVKEKLPKTYLYLSAGIILLVLIFLSFNFWQTLFVKATRSQKSPAVLLPLKKLVPTVSEPEVFLSLQSDQSAFQKGVPFKLNIWLESLQKEVVGADVLLKFDPKKLKIQKVAKGNFLTDPILFKQTPQASGELIISLGSLTAAKGKNIFAEFEVVPQVSGETVEIAISDQSIVALLHQGEKALLSVKGLSFTIK